MMLSILIAFAVGFTGGFAGYYAFSWSIRHVLYSLQCDVADLQERHLRTQRQAAANKRWEGVEELDEQIKSALAVKTVPKAERWKKWASRSESSSDESASGS